MPSLTSVERLGNEARKCWRWTQPREKSQNDIFLIMHEVTTNKISQFLPESLKICLVIPLLLAKQLSFCQTEYFAHSSRRNKISISFMNMVVVSLHCFPQCQRINLSGIEWSLRACEQCIYFCQHEHLTFFFRAASTLESRKPAAPMKYDKE